MHAGKSLGGKFCENRFKIPDCDKDSCVVFDFFKFGRRNTGDTPELLEPLGGVCIAAKINFSAHQIAPAFDYAAENGSATVECNEPLGSDHCQHFFAVVSSFSEKTGYAS